MQVDKAEEQEDSDEPAAADVDADADADADANAEEDADADGEPDAEGETDDARPPENGRHSAPSDDTVFVADASVGMGKPSPIAFTPEAPRVSPPPATSTAEVTRVSTPLELAPTSRPPSRPKTDEDLSDADAEGSTDDEYDK